MCQDLGNATRTFVASRFFTLSQNRGDFLSQRSRLARLHITEEVQHEHVFLVLPRHAPRGDRQGIPVAFPPGRHPGIGKELLSAKEKGQSASMGVLRNVYE